jgi:hypothetical protein
MTQTKLGNHLEPSPNDGHIDVFGVKDRAK